MLFIVNTEKLILISANKTFPDTILDCSVHRNKHVESEYIPSSSQSVLPQEPTKTMRVSPHSPGTSSLFGLQRRAVGVLGGLVYGENCNHCFVDLRILTLPL